MAATAPAFWRHRGFVAVALLPLSCLFGLLAGARRALYRAGSLRVVRSPVPVIIVGNIAVGGSGKTPVVEWLAAHLQAAGRKPGIISRGYGGQVSGAELVPPDGEPARYGDEPVLLARLTGCPVAVGRDRPAVAAELLRCHPECDVLIADDGLQHYRLSRDIEIAVVDAAVLGNGWLLPAGPLREPLSRLSKVDLIVAHGEPVGVPLPAGVPVFPMVLAGTAFRSLRDPETVCDAAAFRGRRVHAVAGIGRPERFFEMLMAMGLEVVPHAFADHHAYVAADLAFAPGEPKLMTSKDAVKCAAFAPAEAWEWPVQARIGSGAIERILEKLNHGRQTA